MSPVFFDTSVLVAMMIEGHDAHERSARWWHKTVEDKTGFIISAHTLAELYSTITSLPGELRVSAQEARVLIESNVEKHAKIVALTATDYARVLTDCSERSITGGAIYDALIAKAAEKSGVTILLTLNTKDFHRVWPGGKSIIREP